MLNLYWVDSTLINDIHIKESMIKKFFDDLMNHHSEYIKECRGVGLMQGVEFYDENMSEQVVKDCFENKLLIETCGPKDQVVKLMPALTINKDLLQIALDQLRDVIAEVCSLGKVRTEELFV